jgi:glycosyltransferase involved in cell wall biosynthesis
MKLAQVNVYFYPHMVGGAEWYVYNISKELVRRGHEIHVYTADTYQGQKITPTDEVVEGINIHRVPLWMNFTYRAKIWKGLENRLLKGDFDIIHTYDYAQPHSYVAVKAGNVAEERVALTVFDVHSMIPRPFYKQFFMKLFDRFVARMTLKRASKVLVRAPNLVEALVGFGTPRERIVVTPSGINDESLKKADGSSFLERYSISGWPVILFLGRLHHTKGLKYLVMAAPAILGVYPDAKFVFVGPDHSGYKSALVMLGQRLGVEDNLLFTGPIYDLQRKLEAYAAADVFVLPSSYEGTSQAVWEAMAQGRPIVATNRGGIPFQVEQRREGLLVEYGDVVALATVLLRLLDDEKLAERLGRRARERVKGLRYSELVGELEDIYRGMLKR